MKKISKIIAIILAILLVIVLIPIGILISIDLNNYKDLIARSVEQQTGRQLQIQGPIDKSFFPWLGVHIGALQLSNASGFGDVPFAKLQEVQVKIKLLPLFKKQLEIDKIVILGLQLNLARNVQGVSNWDDLVAAKIPPSSQPPQSQQKPQQKPQPPSQPQAPTAGQPSAPITQSLAALHIGGVEIRDAALVWDDRQAGQRYQLSKVSLQTGEVQLGKAFPASLSFGFNASQPQAEGTVRWQAMVEAQLEQQRYRLTGMALDVDITGEVLPIPRLVASLSADVDSDLENQTAGVSKLRFALFGSELSGALQAQHIMAQPLVNAQLQWQVQNPDALVKGLQPLLPPTINAALLKNAALATVAKLSLAEQTASLTLQLGDLSVHATMQAEHIMDNPTYHGTLGVKPFNPRPMLQALLGDLPPMAADNALTQVGLNVDYQGGLNEISLKPLAIDVDETKITGFTAVKQFAAPEVEFALHVDTMDVDRYLPPPPPAEAQQPAPSPQAPPPPSPSKEVADVEIPLPVEMLRTLNVKGELTVDKLNAMKLKLAQLKVGVDAKGGVLKADPVQAQLYQGSNTTRVTVDVRGATPAYSLSENLKGVDFGPLVKDFMGDDYVAGAAAIQADLSTEGHRVSALKQHLNGKLQFDFDNGVVKYLDLADILIADYAKYLHKALPANDTGKTTAYRILKGTATITNGVVSNKDLYLESARFQVNGEGKVDLSKETIGYTLNTQITNPTDQMKRYELDKLAGTPIPVHFRGTFSQPEYSVDWEGALRKVAKELAKERLKQEQQKLKEEAKQKLEAEKQKLKEKSEEKKQQELRKLEDKLKEKLKKLF